LSNGKAKPFVLAALALVLTSLCLPARASPAPQVSGEFGVQQQLGSPTDSGFSGYYCPEGFEFSRRPTEIFGSLRIERLLGPIALCVDARHTIQSRGFLFWEDRIGVKAELPISEYIVLFGGWEDRQRIDRHRCVIGAKVRFGPRPD
jgi:hypothetical protein